MKKILSSVLFCVLLSTSFAQTETFDLTSYTAPKGWEKAVEQTITSYTLNNSKNNTWCRINIVKSTVSKGTIEQDFESEWQEMVIKNYQPTDTPKLNKIKKINGWTIKAGSSNFIFNNRQAMVFLTTASGYKRCVSIIAVTNTRDYVKDIEAFLASVNLEKPHVTSTPTPTTNENGISVLGTWCITSSDQSSYRVNNGIVSTIFRQYTFKANGTYTCNIKTFDPVMSSILLGRESGTYQVNGNTLTINPQKSVLEEWSKKNNTDQWGKLLKTQHIALEKVTYSFTKIYIPENNEWQLILKASNATKRDGPFNNYDRNAWIYIASSPARPILKLPGE